MSRSEVVRQEAMRLDGYRCVICSFDGRDIHERLGVLSTHHDEKLGMGGSRELDTVENSVTLCWGVDSCHQHIENLALEIVEWNRAAGVLTVIDHQGVRWKKKGRIPSGRLWFYRRKLAEELEPVEARIQGLHMIDGDVAGDLWRLWKDDAYKVLDPDMVSFAQYAASRGWNARRASRMANLYDTAEQLRIPWPSGTSATDFQRQLKDAGKIEPREYWYLIFGLDYKDSMRIVRTDDEDALYVGLHPWQVAVKVGKWFKVKVDKGKLSGPDGEVIPFERVGVKDDDG